MAGQKPPQDPQWTQISALNNWQSFIKSSQGIMQVLAGKAHAAREVAYVG